MMIESGEWRGEINEDRKRDRRRAVEKEKRTKFQRKEKLFLLAEVGRGRGGWGRWRKNRRKKRRGRKREDMRRKKKAV